MFLSAFRLPGEAQQIDRILNAFSEHCFECCIENTENIVENAEIAYVLSFSLIMLNTDRHNVNIRADRKMTLEQFIKNNTNYGRDLKQTKDLPRDYLETIYHSISSFPLRTERKDETGSVTLEGWMDAQQQANFNTEKGLLTMINYENTTLAAMRQCIYEYSIAASPRSAIPGDVNSYTHRDCPMGVHLTCGDVDAEDCHDENDVDNEADRFFHPNLETVTQKAVGVVLNLLTTADVSDTFYISASMYGQQALVDADLAECIWKDLLPVIACPFMMSQTDTSSSSDVSTEKLSELPSSPGPVGNSSISIALAMAMAVIKISNWYDVSYACDTVVLLFGDFAKVLKGNMVQSLFDNNGLLATIETIHAVGAPIAHIDSSMKAVGHNIQSPFKAARKCLRVLLKGKSARAALCALLKLAHIHPQYLSAIGWTVVFQALSVLRDLEILPGEEMVQYYILDQAFDGIPGSLRNEFEMKMDASNAVAKLVEEPKTRVAIPRSKKSLLSFQGLGEALFGRTDDPEDITPDDGSDSSSRPAASSGYDPQNLGQKKHCEHDINDASKFTSIVSRWDFGYSDAPLSTPMPTMVANRLGTSAHGHNGSEHEDNSSRHAEDGNFDTPAPMRDQGSIEREGGGHYGITALRLAVSGCGVSEIISDSKFVDDVVILKCVKALVNLSDNFSGWGEIKQDNSLAITDDIHSADNFDWSWNQHYAEVDMIRSLVADNLSQLPELSLASTSWLEVVLVEVVVRNRDRMASLWPSLAVHYIRSAVALSTKACSDDMTTAGRATSPLQQQPLEVAPKNSERDIPVLGFSYVDERYSIAVYLKFN